MFPAMTDEGSSKRFGSLLRNYRLGLGLSQERLASRAEVSKSQIALVELGQRRPSRDAALSLAKALSLGPKDRDELLLRAGHAPVGRKTSGSLPGLEKAMEALATDSRLSPEERLYVETLASAFIDWARAAVREGRIELPRGRTKRPRT